MEGGISAGISAFAASCCGVVFEIGRMGRVSNEDICNLAGTVLLVARVGTRRLNFFGHLLCVPDSEPVKECAVFVHGRPRTQCLQCVRQLLGDGDGCCTLAVLFRWPRIRSGWKKLADACFAADL